MKRSGFVALVYCGSAGEGECQSLCWTSHAAQRLSAGSTGLTPALDWNETAQEI